MRGGNRLKRGTGRTAVAALIIGILTSTAGCHANVRGMGEGTSEPMARTGSTASPQASAEKIAEAGVAIVSACGKVSFANASKGLIVSETGLHEDVFDLRDRSTYRPVPFGLEEARRLEALLKNEAGKTAHSQYSAEQTACIGEFADHFQTLTEPLAESDAEQKQLDISAFNKASKDAEQETEQDDKAMDPVSDRR